VRTPHRVAQNALRWTKATSPICNIGRAPRHAPGQGVLSSSPPHQRQSTSPVHNIIHAMPHVLGRRALRPSAQFQRQSSRPACKACRRAHLST
jgi:hypothetical protein